MQFCSGIPIINIHGFQKFSGKIWLISVFLYNARNGKCSAKPCCIGPFSAFKINIHLCSDQRRVLWSDYCLIHIFRKLSFYPALVQPRSFFREFAVIQCIHCQALAVGCFWFLILNLIILSTFIQTADFPRKIIAAHIFYMGNFLQHFNITVGKCTSIGFTHNQTFLLRVIKCSLAGIPCYTVIHIGKQITIHNHQRWRNHKHQQKQKNSSVRLCHSVFMYKSNRLEPFPMLFFHFFLLRGFLSCLLFSLLLRI